MQRFEHDGQGKEFDVTVTNPQLRGGGGGEWYVLMVSDGDGDGEVCVREL